MNFGRAFFKQMKNKIIFLNEITIICQMMVNLKHMKSYDLFEQYVDLSERY